MLLEKEIKKPSVAVIIAYYNGAKWVERALKSVISQTYVANEIIVVNDGSRLDEKEALYALKDKYNFTILDKENGGQGSARNFGVNHAQSEYICFLDQDDFYLPDHIEVLYKAIPKNDSLFGFVYGDCKEADGNGNIFSSAMIKNYSSHPKRHIYDLIRYDMFILPSASLISKKAYQDIKGFDEQFTGYEDDDLFMRLFRKGYNHYFVDKPVYVWCIHTESTSYSIRMSRSRFRYFKKLTAEFIDDPIKGRFYFRDMIVPRFNRLFIQDVIKFSSKKNEERKEVLKILKDYKDYLWGNKYVRKNLKLRISFLVILFSISPLWVLLIMRKISHYPVLRHKLSKLVL